MKFFRYFLFISLLAGTPAFADVSVSSPATGTTVTSPIHYTASASSGSCPKGVASIGIYVNYRRVYVIPGTHLDTSIDLNPGTYHTVVEEWDRCGHATDRSINIRVVPGQTGVSVKVPADNSTVSSPVRFVASGFASSCPKGVASMGVYVDNRRIYVVPGASLNTSLPVNSGRHYTVVEEWDRCGHAASKSLELQVTGGNAGGSVSVQSPPDNSTVASPVHYLAFANASTCPKGVSAMGIYVNNRRIYVAPGSHLNTSVPLSPGTYHTVVEEWDGCGGALTTPVNLNVQSSGPGISSVQVTCNPAVVPVHGTSSCHATVTGTGSYSSAVRWSVNDGSITPAGFFTAPGANATVQVTATSLANSSKTGTATISVQSLTPQTNHVVLVMEENQSYSTVVGNTGSWPNLNNLIADGALPTNYYGNTHPSIGNYFWLTTGQLLTNNDNSTQVWNVDNIARRMLAAGVSFRIYAEGVPRGYVGGNTGPYVIRHEPFSMLSDVGGNPQVAYQHIWPFSQFAADVANGTLPEFAYIVPDVYDDAHNGTPAQADNWLQSQVVAPLNNSPAFAPGGNGLLIVDFDEAATSDSRYGGGHVAPVFWGPGVKRGYRQTSSTIYQHQSMLRTIMQALQLPNPPGAAANAPSMGEFFLQK